MKRRHFIFCTSATMAFISLPFPAFSWPETIKNTLSSPPQMLSRIWDRQTLLAIGHGYHQKYPNDNSQQILSAMLSLHKVSQAKDVAAFLRQQIIQDYQAGEVILVDGWLISLTEARQCAFYSLSQTKD